MYVLIGIVVIVIWLILGFHKGIWLSLLHLIGTLFSIIIAHQLYLPLSQYLSLFIPFPKTVAFETDYAIAFEDPEQAFIRLVSFIIVLLMTHLCVSLVWRSVSPLLKDSNHSIVSRWLGVVCSGVMGAIVLHFLFHTFALYPNTLLQSGLKASSFGQWFILHVPVLSDLTLNL